MKFYSSRFGTNTRRLGYVGEAAADAEDADQGYYMAMTGPVTAGTAPMNPQGSADFWTPLITQTIPTLAERGIALKQSLDVAALNRDLIRSGKAPLSNAQIAALQPGVRFGLSSDTQNLLIYGGLALLGVYLVSSITKR